MFKYAVLTAIALIGLTGAPVWASALKMVDGRIYAPVVEMVAPGGQKVLLVGMSHTGFPAYYGRVNRHILDWAAQGESQTVVLREFFTASRPVFDKAGPVRQADVDALTEIDFQSQEFLQMEEGELAPVLNAFGMRRTPAALDVDGQTLRPPYYSQRNRAACDEAAKYTATCQWRALQIPDSATVRNVEADLRVDTLPAGTQFLASALFRLEEWKLKVNDPVKHKIERASMAIVQKYRNPRLIVKLLEEISSGAERLVLPWGAAHIRDLHQTLSQIGFRTTAIHDILLMDHADFGKWPEMDSRFKHPFYPLDEDYGLSVSFH